MEAKDNAYRIPDLLPDEFHELISDYENSYAWRHKGMDTRQLALAERVLAKLRQADTDHVCLDEAEEGGRILLDSLAWSKKFEILSISRLDLSAFGLTTEQINQLTDEDMEHIAEELYHRYDLNGFGEDVLFVVTLLLAEQQEGEAR